MSKLYIVPTPVGNLEDITLRAIKVLKNAAFIMAEDTRTSSILLKHLGINTRAVSYHKYNEHKSVGILVDQIRTAESSALISDAGTPGISDPGFLLVRHCIAEEIEVECLPGATAFVPALIESGLPSDRFHFEGFLPVKKGRKTRLAELAEFTETVILYESPYRISKTLEELARVAGSERPSSVSREISKLFHETIRGGLGDLLLWSNSKTMKGEFVIVMGGKKDA